MSSADNLCKQFGPRSDLDPNCLKLWWYSWNNFSKMLNLKNICRPHQKNDEKLPSMQRVNSETPPKFEAGNIFKFKTTWFVRGRWFTWNLSLILLGVKKVKFVVSCSCNLHLTLYSIITPFDYFEISCIWKYYRKWSICSFGANAPFSIIFSKVFKT